MGHGWEEELTGRVKGGLREVDEGKSGVRVDSSIFGTHWGVTIVCENNSPKGILLPCGRGWVSASLRFCY